VRRSSYRSPSTGATDEPGLLRGATARVGLVLVCAAAVGCGGPQAQAPVEDPSADGGAGETGAADTAQPHESGDPVEDVPSAPDAPPPDLWVNELVADNQDGLRDEDGDPSDWIELYNATPDPVSLAGWSLTDDPEDPSKWLLPDVELAGTDFLVVFASGKDRTEGELHTNFSLSAKGEPLLLYAPDGTLHHSYDPDFPAQLPHVSYGMVQEALELLATGATARWWVPGDGALGEDWTQPDFDAAAWSSGATPLGFDADRTLSTSSETFDLASEDLATDYPGWSAVSSGGGAASVEDGALHLSGSGNLQAMVDLILAPPFTVAGKVGANGANGAGGFNVGIAIGDVTVVFHPDYPGGAFRFGTVNDGTVKDNEDVGFTPATGVLHDLVVTATQSGTDVHLAAVLTDGSDPTNVFESEVTVDAATIGADADGLLPGVGFSRNGGAGDDGVYDDLSVEGGVELLEITTDLADDVYDLSAGVYLRQTFELTDPAALRTLSLGLRYDDGLVVWLNGVEVWAANAPDPVTWDAAATAAQPDPDAPAEETVDLSGFLDLLLPGTNVLAVQVLNASVDDADLYLDTTLVGTLWMDGTTAWFVEPTPEAHNGAGVPGFIEDVPTVSPSPGTFVDPIEVTLTTDLPGARVVYSVDGEAPGADHPAAAKPVALETSTLLRARVVDADGAQGPAVDLAYVHLAADLADFDSPLPIVIVENFGAGTVPNKGWSSSGFDVVQVERQTAHLLIREKDGDRAPLLGAATVDQRMGVRVRGAASSGFEQPNYSVELWDEYDQKTDLAILGMAAESDWNLYFPNTDRDSSMLQNAWTYAVSREIGHWAAEVVFAEVFVNEDGGSLSLDDSRGLVLVMEQVKTGPDRLDIVPLSDDGTEGGWLLSINRVDAEPVGGGEPQCFHTAGPNRIPEADPNGYGAGDDIPQQWNAFINFDTPGGYEINDLQRASIEGWFTDMEDVLYGDDWLDPVTGYRAWIDVADFIDYFLVHDITRNGDGLLISM
jgi:CotH kinase protein/Lamin Tail Domain/Chitobiase/beta-hexosaminidase C-terminal domain